MLRKIPIAIATGAEMISAIAEVTAVPISIGSAPK